MGVAFTSLVPGDARFKPGGSVAWSRAWAGPSAGNDSCRSLCLAGTRGLFAGGTVGGSGGLDAIRHDLLVVDAHVELDDLGHLQVLAMDAGLLDGRPGGLLAGARARADDLHDPVDAGRHVCSFAGRPPVFEHCHRRPRVPKHARGPRAPTPDRGERPRDGTNICPPPLLFSISNAA